MYHVVGVYLWPRHWHIRYALRGDELFKIDFAFLSFQSIAIMCAYTSSCPLYGQFCVRGAQPILYGDTPLYYGYTIC